MCEHIVFNDRSWSKRIHSNVCLLIYSLEVRYYCCCCCCSSSSISVVRCGWVRRKGKTVPKIRQKKNRYHLRRLLFNTVWKEVTMSCVQHVTYFLNAFNFMVKSFDVIFSLFLIGFVRNPQIIDNNGTTVFSQFSKVVTV